MSLLTIFKLESRFLDKNDVDVGKGYRGLLMGDRRGRRRWGDAG
jgi:hypothetical protein